MNVSGFWEPHSSSVDFCEVNYFASSYVVEVHNTWSSLFISLIGLAGMLFSNPSKEWRFFFMFGVLFSIGLGSTLLHSTLHWIFQSSDEIPMLWQNLSFLFALIEMRSPRGKNRNQYIPHLFGIFVAAQTVIYYKFQSLYAAFLFSYISVAAIVVVWAAIFAFSNENLSTRPLRIKLWSLSMMWFILIGGVVWIIDMNLCDWLIPFYNKIGGLTLHVIWHIAAGLGCYLMIIFMVVSRLSYLHLIPKLHWYFGVLPIVTLDNDRAKNS